jgi:2-polyprenyl-3-methyl-5-hydroxy-6-metoxy-1,4-benzoquinol methylase
MSLRCIVCGGERAQEAFISQDRLLAAASGSFRYVRCAACGTVRADPPPDDATLAAAYPDAYVGRGLTTSLLQRAGDVLGRREARRLVESGSSGGRALDVGCGDGIFLQRLRAAGWHGPLHGLDPNPAAAARARARGIRVEEATLEDFQGREGYDLVILRHVIEHLRDPRAALARIHSFLAPGGLAYVATPDEGALSARVFGRYWAGYDPPRHLWVFRPPAVRRLLEEAGFAVLDEQWYVGAEMWTASLAAAISPRPGRRRLFASAFNPLVAVPALAAGTVEMLLHRSTMYAAIGRRDRG